jgi:glycosyltransferase involved in cell wall biosynthesis
MQFDEDAVVAIPVRDEEDTLGACLSALARQTRRPRAIVLLLNNCTDLSLDICKAALSYLPLHIVERTLSGEDASAGEARRLALSHAAALAPSGVILTTDADAVPPDDWVAQNLAEIGRGAEAVCGQARIDAAGAWLIPERLHEEHRKESACLAALDALHAAIDPDPADPWPRHQSQPGASIAVTSAALKRAGGPPHVATAEDRTLIARLRMVDARIRHAPQIEVTVSGRLHGRAAGGMADTIRRRIKAPDPYADPALEPAIDAYRRAIAKARLRRVYHAGEDARALAEDLLIPAPFMARALKLAFFGAAWAQVQLLSPVLQRRRLPAADLPRETRLARLLHEQWIADLSQPASVAATGGQRLAG